MCDLRDDNRPLSNIILYIGGPHPLLPVWQLIMLMMMRIMVTTCKL